MTPPAGEIGQLRNEDLPAIRVIVPPDTRRRLFADDLDPGDVVFDGQLTAMLVWHERYPIGRGWRSGWVLSYDTDGRGNPDDYIVGLGLGDIDAAVAQARDYLRAVGYPVSGWKQPLSPLVIRGRRWPRGGRRPGRRLLRWGDRTRSGPRSCSCPPHRRPFPTGGRIRRSAAA